MLSLYFRRNEIYERDLKKDLLLAVLSQPLTLIVGVRIY